MELNVIIKILCKSPASVSLCRHDLHSISTQLNKLPLIFYHSEVSLPQVNEFFPPIFKINMTDIFLPELSQKELPGQLSRLDHM